MITKTAQTLQRSGYEIPGKQNWQSELARAVRDPAELLALLDLPTSLLPAAQRAVELFPLRVPHSFIARMRRGDMHDPLLRQILPLADELEQTRGVSDPVGDLDASVSPGLLHKYHGRALMITTGACAIHCRYCFRRHFPYASQQAGSQQWADMRDYLMQHSEIEEIILSGGDPLSLSDHRLAECIDQLHAIPHLTTLRIHTRLPVVLPERVTQTLLHTLASSRLQVVIVLHINHANEIDTDVAQAVAALRRLDIQCLNQAVLLRGVNDSSETLIQLSKHLFANGILPYYLHQFDPVRQAHHFEVEIDRGRQLWNELQARLPGYLVPRYVQEIPGHSAKMPVSL